MLETGENAWAIARAEKAALIVDADAYFRHARTAMLQAKHRIMLIGWDFDARIRLGDAGADGGPETVGEFIYWLVERNPQLEVFLLRWDIGALKTLVRGTTILTVFKWMRHPRIHTKLDGAHPAGASHHQKIVVIDDCFAFCGGIDMTGDRWDTRAHRDDEAGRVRPNGRPYGPWHDATSALQGPVAARLGELARMRWKVAGGGDIPPVTGDRGACWPDGLEPDFRDVDVAISRSQPEVKDLAPVVEIEQLYIDQIARAERYIYAESQYFASRRIAIAIADRLAEPDGPEIVLVNPESADGWLEPLAMDTARARLVEALHKRDRYGRFRLYHPYTAGGEPIYVHAKILIVDDRILRVGSSNMNNRSMRLDTECDVTIDSDLPGNRDCRERIAALRDDLLAEHLGVEPAAVTAAIETQQSLIAAVEALRGPGRSLRPYEVPDLSAVEEWLADNEILDPEGPDAMFETLAKRHLLKGLGRRFRRPR